MVKLRRAAAIALITVLALAVLCRQDTLSLTTTSDLPPHPDPASVPPDAQSTTGPTPPDDILLDQAAVQPQDPVIISDVPVYDWRHGCGPTAAGMVIGYWDTSGFGALVPGDASVQTDHVNMMIASGDLAGDMGTNYTDYCLPQDSDTPDILPDKSEPPAGDEHPDHCVADFMKTSQSAYGNRYGWSWFSPVGPAMTGYVRWLGRPDYAASTRRLYMDYDPQLTWSVFRAEIDTGRPMVFLVDTGGDGWTDHFVTVIGYDESTHSYGCLDTWGSSVRWFAFAPLAYGQPWGIYGAVAFEISVSNLTMERATTASETGRNSWDPTLSAGGDVVAFVSDSDLWNQGVPDEQNEVWLYDRATLGYTRITTSTADRDGSSPFLSASGTKVAFSSDADLLHRGNPDEQWEIWLYDTVTVTYTQVTTAAHSLRDSWDPALDADGSTVAFQSDADLLSQNIPDDQFEVWLYDTVALTYTRVTTGTPGRGSWNPSLNDDGTVVAFVSDVDLLNQGIPDDQNEIWLYHATTSVYTRVTTATDSGRDSMEPHLSADGTLVAFASDADLLGQGIPDDQHEIWLYNARTMTYTRVTTATDASRDSYGPVLSADGTRIVFYSDANLAGQGIPDGQFEIWLCDVADLNLSRVTWASEIDRDGYLPVLSSGGETIAFYSDSDIMAERIPDDQYEIWLHHVLDKAVFLPVLLREAP